MSWRGREREGFSKSSLRKWWDRSREERFRIKEELRLTSGEWGGDALRKYRFRRKNSASYAGRGGKVAYVASVSVQVPPESWDPRGKRGRGGGGKAR